MFCGENSVFSIFEEVGTYSNHSSLKC